MKCLTICQPYASLIIGWDGMPESERKRVENRTWETSHRGSLLIHAGKSKEWLDTWDGPVPDEMPFGVILGVVDVVDCVRWSDVGGVTKQYPWLKSDQYATGPWCWILENPLRFPKPIPYGGLQGLWNVLDARVAEQIKAARAVESEE